LFAPAGGVAPVAQAAGGTAAGVSNVLGISCHPVISSRTTVAEFISLVIAASHVASLVVAPSLPISVEEPIFANSFSDNAQNVAPSVFNLVNSENAVLFLIFWSLFQKSPTQVAALTLFPAERFSKRYFRSSMYASICGRACLIFTSCPYAFA
jgi:hypothetical protein